MRARPQNQHWSRLLHVLGDNEPLSRAERAELGNLMRLSGSKLELKRVIYRRSPTPAIGKPHIVLSELGDTAGPTGATRPISDHVFAAT